MIKPINKYLFLNNLINCIHSYYHLHYQTTKNPEYFYQGFFIFNLDYSLTTSPSSASFLLSLAFLSPSAPVSVPAAPSAPA